MNERIPERVLEILPPAKWEAIWFKDVLVLVSPEHPVMVACEGDVAGRWTVTQIDPSKPVPQPRSYWGGPMVTDEPKTSEQPSGLTAEIAVEIYHAVEKLDAKSDLLGIIGSWCDTMPDSWVLEQLRRYNERGGK